MAIDRKIRAAATDVSDAKPERPPLDQEDGDDDKGGDGEGERTLHEEAARRSGRGAGKPAARVPFAFERRHQPRPDRRGDEEGEREIRQRHPGEREVAKRGCGDRAGEQAALLVVPAASECRGDEDEPDARERGPQARGKLRGAGDEIRGARQPVVQRRLLKTDLVVEVRSQPVTRLHHLARRFGIEGFVGIGDRAATKRRKEGQHGQQEDRKRGPAHHR